MRAIVYRPSIRRVAVIRTCFPLPLLVACVVPPMLGGCSQGRFFSPLAGRGALDDSAPSMHGPAMGGTASMRTQATHQSVSRNSSGQVRVTSEDAIPETDIEPVPQRLTPTHSASSPATEQVSHRTDLGTKADRPSQSPQPNQQITARQATPDVVPAGHVTSFSDNGPTVTLELPDGYDGVDVSGLMSALQDAPPEVQKAAIARLIAMSRSRARTTTQPQSIDDALATAFDSLPELPDEVVDRGVNPTRIGNSNKVPTGAISTATHTALSAHVPENTQPIASAWASDGVARLSNPLPIAPIATVDLGADATSRVSVATIQVPVPSTSGGGLGNDPLSDITSQPPTAASSEMTDAELYDALVARLQTKVEGESDAERHRRQVVARHLMVLAGDPDRAVNNLEGLSHQEQEYLRHQLLGLWTIIDPKGHPVPSRRFSSALPEIRKATSFLAAASDSLEVRGLEFCTEIEAYGQVKPFPKRRFLSGQEVILYCEIDNFVSQSVDGGFETRLQGSYDLLDATGHRVSSQTLPEDHQVSKNRLRDYFIAYQMYLPDSIEPGAYQLRLTMEDVHGKKYGQSTVNFEIKR